MSALPDDDPVAAAAIAAIRGGDVEALRRLLAERPSLASARIVRSCTNGHEPFTYPLIGAAVDWPGHFPNVAATISALVAAGADVNARCSGAHEETPLHWAASSNDLIALDALLDAGAEIEARGAVIACGTPLDDAVGFGQWRAAHRLVERGAYPAVWHAAALGLVDRIEEHLGGKRPRDRYPWVREDRTPQTDIQVAFWCACHGGQGDVAKLLLKHGAELHWLAPWDGTTPLDAARRCGAQEVVTWLESQSAGSDARPSANRCTPQP